MLPNGNKNYHALFMQMMRAFIRATLGHQGSFQFQFSERQAAALGCLVTALKVVSSPDGVSLDLADALVKYQKFCWSLVERSSEELENRWNNPIERFIWLAALREDGSFIQASDLTPVLAKLKYFCRLTTLYQALFITSTASSQESMIGWAAFHHLSFRSSLTASIVCAAG